MLSFLFFRQPLLLCLCLAPHSRTSFNFPYFFVFPRTLAPKILLSMPAPGPSFSVLFHIPLPFPPMYLLSLLHFLFSYFPCLSRTFPPSSSVLLYSFLPYFPILWILLLPWLVNFYLYCVCTMFFFPFRFTGVFLKILFMIDDLVFSLFYFFPMLSFLLSICCINCACLHFWLQYVFLLCFQDFSWSICLHLTTFLFLDFIALAVSVCILS